MFSENQLIIASFEKKFKIPASNYKVYLNIIIKTNITRNIQSVFFLNVKIPREVQ